MTAEPFLYQTMTKCCRSLYVIFKWEDVMEFINMWLKGLIENLDEQNNFEVLQACGKQCAQDSGMIKR